ncbi:hypothetical protein LPJ57_003429 [Coemansia sp. RSA 486]|nr:hypothetical protein LPJ57_003429 [Coemansia sp. RSA 486]KAJ2231423.1 hypothetical protein IWW45_005474 [Coemansia sp. RSA 485]
MTASWLLDGIFPCLSNETRGPAAVVEYANSDREKTSTYTLYGSPGTAGAMNMSNGSVRYGVQQGVDDYHGRLDAIRRSEYPQLFEPGTSRLKTVFLDHTGSTLYAASHIRAMADELLANIPANPHSQHTASQWTHLKIEQVRDRLLRFFGTTAEKYAVVFTANATGAIRLAGELTPLSKKGVFCYSRESHTSVVGVRSIAAERGVAIRPADFDEIKAIVLPENTAGTSLLAYPAQCNFSGQRFPLDVADTISSLYRSCDDEESSHSPWWVLLDAAGFASSSPLKLDTLKAGPDFVAASIYKIFGAPTGLGVLLIKRSSIPYLRPKRYFGGGTVANLSFDRTWQEFRRDIESRLEDGTLNFQAIVSLNHALDAHARNFGSLENVAWHTQSVTKYALKAMKALRHKNGSPICHIYGHDDGCVWGPIVAFNLKDIRGQFIGFREVERLAVMAGIALRTGRFCNPGAAQKWLQFTTPELIHLASLGYACGDENDIVAGKPVGALRVSFGAVTSKREIDCFIEFLVRHYLNYAQPLAQSRPETPLVSSEIEPKPTSVSKPGSLPVAEPPACLLKAASAETIDTTSTQAVADRQLDVEIDRIIIYPIKSCHGWEVARSVPWELTRHGLKFDRAFVVMRHNDSRPMQQKRYPRMALIRPHIDLGRSLMILEAPDHPPLEVSLMADQMNLERIETLVCSSTMQAFRIISDEISSWLSSVLKVSCYLACEPQLLFSDTSSFSANRLSQSESLSSSISPLSASTKGEGMSFVNNSQLLMVTNESADQVDRWVKEESNSNNGSAGLDSSRIGPMQYRPNLIIKSASGTEKARALEPFEELKWNSVSFGSTQLTVSGPCTRCQMIGVDQESAKVLKEPFSTLARKMRVDGKIVFGMYLDNHECTCDASGAYAFIQPGSIAQVQL